MSFLIRPWAKRDVWDVMRLVKELAVSHNALHQVTTSPEALQKDGFEKDAIFGYLVAEVPPAQKSKEGHTIVGYQFHYLTYCTWDGPILFGEDLYVMPEFRGSGGIRGYPHQVGSLYEKGGTQGPSYIPF
ncbi:diamine acetyltransferase 2-like [Pseudonaja textilis]|uniref:diamine acetyltransferase 2-like n=1 Tax=Pseudonaja textilis TaxID=8673 RepID=UPI000EAAAA28|nr:diamine acetyltransferase 2-like [Pseudonaja textilis]